MGNVTPWGHGDHLGAPARGPPAQLSQIAQILPNGLSRRMSGGDGRAGGSGWGRRATRCPSRGSQPAQPRMLPGKVCSQNNKKGLLLEEKKIY